MEGRYALVTSRDVRRQRQGEQDRSDIRVIEIPKPRWTCYDAFRFGIEIPRGAPVSTQERAYTSPIWYTP
jgi:hypothetical protein